MSASMNMLWSLLNSLQLIVTMPLLNLKFPSHTEYISSILNDVANLKVLKINWINHRFLDFSKSVKRIPVRPRFRDYAYESTNFILNSEILFWILLIHLLLCAPVHFGNKLSKGKKAKKVFYYMHTRVFFNSIIRFLLESYMDLYLNAILNIFNLYFGDVGGSISSVLSILFVAVSTLSPFMLHYFLRAKFYRFKEKTFEERFGCLYEGIDLCKKPAHLFYFYFIVRRMTYCLSYYFFDELVVLQLAVLNIGSFWIVAFIASVKPFRRKFLNHIELFNESIILLLSYFCWTFSDYQPNVPLKDELGWLYIYIIFLTIFANILFMFYDSVIKPCIDRRRIKRLKQEKQRIKKQDQSCQLRKQTASFVTSDNIMDFSNLGIQSSGKAENQIQAMIRKQPKDKILGLKKQRQKKAKNTENQIQSKSKMKKQEAKKQDPKKEKKLAQKDVKVKLHEKHIQKTTFLKPILKIKKLQSGNEAVSIPTIKVQKNRKTSFVPLKPKSLVRYDFENNRLELKENFQEEVKQQDNFFMNRTIRT